MFKFVILFALIAFAASSPVQTPLLAKLIPQPKAPANTEHAGYVSALTPVLTPLAAPAVPLTYYQPAASVYAAPLPAPVPLTYANNLAYASSYQIAY